MATILRLKEAADYLRLHPSTIYRMLKRRELPAFRTGQEALDKWVAEETAKQQNGGGNG